MPLNHDDGSDSDVLWIRSAHRSVASVAVLAPFPRGAEYRQIPGRCLWGEKGFWPARRRGGGLGNNRLAVGWLVER
jgi:hypothetical protein